MELLHTYWRIKFKDGTVYTIHSAEMDTAIGAAIHLRNVDLNARYQLAEQTRIDALTIVSVRLEETWKAGTRYHVRLWE